MKQRSGEGLRPRTTKRGTSANQASGQNSKSGNDRISSNEEIRTIPESVTEGASARRRRASEVRRERGAEISATVLELACCIAQESTKSVRMRVKASRRFGRQQLDDSEK